MNGYFNTDENGDVSYTIEGYQNKFYIYIENNNTTKPDYMMHIISTKECVYLSAWSLEEAFKEAVDGFNF